MENNNTNTYSEEYVKELREEAKSWRLKFREAEKKIEELTAEVTKRDLDFKKFQEDVTEKIKEYEELKKELEVVKPKAEQLEQKIKNDLLNKIPDEKLREEAVNKYKDIEQLEFFVNSISNFTKQPKSTMDNSQKSTTSSAEAEYLKSLESGNILKAIALKNRAMQKT